MKIIEKTYSLNGKLKKRSKTEKIILHHRAGSGDVESIDKLHKGNGWTCIGYHFYIRKDGSIYRGRKEDTIGAHATNHNSTSIGICFEGNFENEKMSKEQINSGIELVTYLKEKYKITKVLRHKDVGKTACPGKNFPFSEITDGKVENVPHGTKTIDQLAKEVLDGKWGNAPDRKKNLEKAGYNYSEVQKRVNELLKGNKNVVEYYPKCNGFYISFADGLKSIGVDSSFAFRKKIAFKNGINEYKGTFTQNLSLLSKLKAGRLKKV